MSEVKSVNVGDVVVFHDPKGNPFNAIVTAVWSQLPCGCINVVCVQGEESMQDQYGRQIVRQTSVSHKDTNHVHGYYWRFVDEEPNPYIAPVQR
jgi:hypothetical protein